MRQDTRPSESFPISTQGFQPAAVATPPVRSASPVGVCSLTIAAGSAFIHACLEDVGTILSAAEIKRLRTSEKLMHYDWQTEILSHVGAHGYHRIKILTLGTGPLRGDLQIYGRIGEDPADYSAALLYRDLSGAFTPIVRMNGPHDHVHTNQFPRRYNIPIGPHAHYLTERYQRDHAGNPKRAKAAGYGLLTTAFTGLPGALEALARRTNIVRQTPSLPFKQDLP